MCTQKCGDRHKLHSISFTQYDFISISHQFIQFSYCLNNSRCAWGNLCGLLCVYFFIVVVVAEMYGRRNRSKKQKKYIQNARRIEFFQKINGSQSTSSSWRTSKGEGEGCLRGLHALLLEKEPANQTIYCIVWIHTYECSDGVECLFVSHFMHRKINTHPLHYSL